MGKQITFTLAPDGSLTSSNEGVTIKELLGVACAALKMVQDQGEVSTVDILAMVESNLRNASKLVV